MSPGSFYFKLASDLSSRFVSITPDRLDEEIRHALRQIMGFFVADCCAIFKAFERENRVELVQAVDTGWASPQCSGLDTQALAPQLLLDVLGDKRSISLRMGEELPPGMEVHRTRLAHMCVESLLLVPISTGTSVTYLFKLVSTRDGNAWSQAHTSQFRLLAEILVNAMCRKGMQEALQRTTRDLSEAQRICRLGSLKWEVDSGRIVDMEEVERILGMKPATHARFMELVYAPDRDRLQKAIDNARSRNATNPLIEYRILTRRGEIRIVKSRFEVIPSENGPHVVGTFHDVTDARRGEQELQLLRTQHWHADRVARTGVLVASLAHELSQPLSAILSNAQAGLRFLDQEPLDRREIRDILKDIVADNRRARQVIDTLRAMIRREKTPRVKVDATDIAREVLALLHSEFVAQQVEVELACKGGCFVLADKTQIEQILLNLMLNSVESMRDQPIEQRHLQVQVSRAGKDEVQVSVCDTGVGIPKDQLGSVFEAFWTTKAHGLGMGLAVCRSIVEAHGGRIWAEPNSNRGVTFIFRLPAAT